jgi:hypothetical protein
MTQRKIADLKAAHRKEYSWQTPRSVDHLRRHFTQEYVKLEAFNVLGQHVKELFTGILSPGRHSFLFTAAGLPSGMLCYRLLVGSHSYSRGMMFLQ